MSSNILKGSKNEKNIIASVLGAAVILSGCGGGGDDAAQVIADEFVTISGQITNGPAPEEGVTVRGIYSDGNPLNPSETTAADGTFSIKVLKNTAVSAQASKSGFATLNSAKEALNANESGVDIEMVTTADAEAAIVNVFSGPTLASHAWLIVDVVDSADAEVNGVTISTTGNPVDTAATDCNGLNSGTVPDVTIAPCPFRDVPMYFAYFDADSTEVTVTAGSDSQLAPVRRGEVTFLEFEVVASAPVGTFAAGQAKYDAACENCHAAGTHDTTLEVTKAGDLYDKGELLISDLSSLGGMSTVVNLTTQEILDLNAFLESVTIKP